MIPSQQNTNIFLEINRFAQRTPALHGLFYAIATYGSLIFALLLIIGWLYARRHAISKMVAVVWAGIGTVVAIVVNQSIVHYFHEARPYTNLSHILVLGQKTADFSFPSDHSVMVGAITAGLFKVNPWLGAVSLVFALLLGFSRIYIAVHYPYDVLAGLALGAAVVLAGYFVLRKPMEIAITKLLKTPLRPLFTD